MCSPPFPVNNIRDLSEISRGEGGGGGGGGGGGWGWKQREGQLFETAEKGGVMKNGSLKGGGSRKYVSVIM